MKKCNELFIRLALNEELSFYSYACDFLFPITVPLLGKLSPNVF